MPLLAFSDEVAADHTALAPIWVAITAMPTGNNLLKNGLLGISYFVPRFDWLDTSRWQASATPTVQPPHRAPAEFLWQADCLECFFAGADASGYVEINISPDAHAARFNAYRFTDYRTPNTLPPPTTTQFVVGCIPAGSTLTPAVADYYTRHVVICLADGTTNVADFKLTHIQPCAILYRHSPQHTTKDEDAVFFAPQHTSPPDFHHQPVWQILP